ncbi:MAG: hypothetical protein LBG58_11370 [Planctomycetaceae bacterium]|jgi:hypothetical protein|nr:hypothetical protein [Planctomycetaceae bacterium]
MNNIDFGEINQDHFFRHKIGVYFSQHASICNFKTSESWVILSPIEQRIKAKIEAVGTPLKDWDIKIYRGILTGYNVAFIISGDKRNELIKQDPKSEGIIRPILRGRDIKRYGYEFADLWLINTHNGIKEKGIKPINIDDYPAIKKHLDNYWDKIEKRADQGDTPYNLRNCAYMEDFYKQKIVWARLMRISKNDFYNFPRFAIIPKEIFIVDSLCFFTGNDLFYLQGLLNSEFAQYYFFNNIAILDDGGMQMRQQYVELMPIPIPPDHIKIKISELVKHILKNTNIDNSNLINQYVYNLYGFTNDEIHYIKQYLQQKEKEIMD